VSAFSGRGPDGGAERVGALSEGEADDGAGPVKALSRRLGVFAKTFRRAAADEVAGEVRQAGYALGHWNFAAVGLPTLAGGVADAVFVDVRKAFDAVGVGIPSMSATFNVIGADVERRALEIRQAVGLIRRAGVLGAEVVTLCTGTRDVGDMWRAHPGNASDAAWHELREALDVLMEAALDGGVVLGIEPEPGNVVRDAAAAGRLLVELGDGAPVGIVFDPANLLSSETSGRRQGAILTEAVDVLGPRTVGVQLKGFEVMDYDLVFRLLERVPPVPLIVQDVSEGEAAGVRRELLRRYG
jgi:sugar phosphate isomerase/epimerase